MDATADRVLLWLLRFLAKIFLFAGIAEIGAAAVAFGVAELAPALRSIAMAVSAIAVVFVGGGATALYLGRLRAPALPNEREVRESTPLGGWLLGLAAALVAIPLALTILLQPLLAEARTVIAITPWADLWPGANANGARLVLIPLAFIAAPPLLELASLAACAGASALLFVRLMARSRRLPRLFLVSVMLLGTLIIASVIAARASSGAAAAARTLIEESSPRADERALITDIVERYDRVVGGAAWPIALALLAYAAFVPPLLTSRRACETFAGHPPRQAAAGGVIDLEAATRPPESGGF